MGNKYVKLGLIKGVFILPLIVVSFYSYYKFNNVTFLYILALIVILICLEHIIVLKSIPVEKLDDSQSEVTELKRKLMILEEQLKSATASTDEIDSIRNELELKDEELMALSDAAQMITSSLNVKNIVEHVYNVFNKFTCCDRYLICFLEKDHEGTESLVCKYEYGSVIFHMKGTALRKDNVIERCLSKKETAVRTNHWIELRKLKGDCIWIPLKVSGESVGIIYIESSTPGTFSDINVDFLESLSAYVAIAIKNAEMFNSIYTQKEEIEALYEQTTAVNEELNSYLEELNKTKEELKQKNNELTRYYDDIQTGYFQTVMALANSIEAKDPYTRGHCQRVMEISCEIAIALGYRDTDIDELRYAAILHDIGKIGVSAAIINKTEKLTDQEFNEIKKHPMIAYNILKDILFIQEGLEGILQHHERFDGKGYPNGIKGFEICEFGRILCIADAFDAMTSDRPYRKGMSMEDAIKEIERCKGTQFDPKIADVFIEMSRESIDKETGIFNMV